MARLETQSACLASGLDPWDQKRKGGERREEWKKEEKKKKRRRRKGLQHQLCEWAR